MSEALSDSSMIFWAFALLILLALAYGVFSFFFTGGQWPDADRRRARGSPDPKPGQPPRSHASQQVEIQAKSSGYPDQGGP